MGDSLSQARRCRRNGSDELGFTPPNQRQNGEGTYSLEASHKLKAQEDGTLLTAAGQVELAGFFKLAEGLVGNQFDRQVTAALGALKILLEADAN